MHDACLLQIIMQKQTQGLGFEREPWDSSHVGPLLLRVLMDGSELPLPSRTYKRKCSWKTGFLLSGTVFVFCLHFESASGTIDIFTEKNKQRVTTVKASTSTELPALPLQWQGTGTATFMDG